MAEEYYPIKQCVECIPTILKTQQRITQQLHDIDKLCNEIIATLRTQNAKIQEEVTNMRTRMSGIETRTRLLDSNMMFSDVEPIDYSESLASTCSKLNSLENTPVAASTPVAPSTPINTPSAPIKKKRKPRTKKTDDFNLVVDTIIDESLVEQKKPRKKKNNLKKTT